MRSFVLVLFMLYSCLSLLVLLFTYHSGQWCAVWVIWSSASTVLVLTDSLVLPDWVGVSSWCNRSWCAYTQALASRECARRWSKAEILSYNVKHYVFTDRQAGTVYLVCWNWKNTKKKCKKNKKNQSSCPSYLEKYWTLGEFTVCIIVIIVQQVEKMYFGSHLLRKPENMRERLVEGLSQVGHMEIHFSLSMKP